MWRFLALAVLALPLSAASLAIVNAAVHESEGGPVANSSTQFVAGETVYLDFQLTGYHVSPDQKIKLSVHIDAFDPKGVLVVESIDTVLDTVVSPQDKDWKPKVRQSIVLPPIVPSGEFHIKAAVEDDVSHDKAAADIAFHVTAPQVEASPELTLRNFNFYRGEDDPAPLPVAAYRPGDALFARFDITGFRYGDRNTVNVSYGVSVLTSAGKVLYTQPEAAVENSFSFYPKPYVPGAMNLSLQKNMPLGEYTLVVNARDLVGKQTCEVKKTFRLE